MTEMQLFSMRRPADKSAIFQGTLFVFLNIVDAWMTAKLLAIGGVELNWHRLIFGVTDLFSGTNLVLIKALAAWTAVVILTRLGKERILGVLNVCMGFVVLNNSINLIAYIGGFFNWF